MTWGMRSNSQHWPGRCKHENVCIYILQYIQIYIYIHNMYIYILYIYTIIHMYVNIYIHTMYIYIHTMYIYIYILYIISQCLYIYILDRLICFDSLEQIR